MASKPFAARRPIALPVKRLGLPVFGHERTSTLGDASRAGMVAILALLVVAGQGRAAGPGQEDLDKATAVKISAKTIGDLTQVIELVESAIDKGLDQGDEEFGRNLLAASLIQRGTSLASVLLSDSAAAIPAASRRATALAALSDLERGVTISPKEPQTLYLIARLNVLTGGAPDRCDEAIRKAIEYSDDEPQLKAKALVFRATLESDTEKKMADLDEAVRVFPDGAEAWRSRGLLRAQLEKPEEALADLDKAIELEAGDAATYEARAVVLAQLKQFDEALVSLDRAQELNPTAVRPLLEKAQIHGLQENLDAAIHELSRARELDPTDVSVLLLRAAAYRDKGEPADAMADVDAALKLVPQLPSAMRLRAVLLDDAGQRPQAIAQLEELRRISPDDLLNLLQLGMLYSAGDEFAKSLDAYSAALALQSDDPAALRGRGDALLNMGKHEQAVADYETLLKLEPEDPGTLNNLAWVLATSPDEKVRNGERAVKLATQACELTEYTKAYILSTLAAAYAESGDFDAAVQWAEKGVTIAGEDEKEPLGKELESYRKREPWREILSVEEPPVEEPKPEEPEVSVPEG